MYIFKIVGKLKIKIENRKILFNVMTNIKVQVMTLLYLTPC